MKLKGCASQKGRCYDVVRCTGTVKPRASKRHCRVKHRESMSSGLFSEALTPQSILVTDVSGYSVGPVFVDKVLRSAVPTEDR